MRERAGREEGEREEGPFFAWAAASPSPGSREKEMRVLIFGGGGGGTMPRRYTT